MKVITYPERVFRKMVRSTEYTPGDYFISIDHANPEFTSWVEPPGEKFLRLEFDDVEKRMFRCEPISGFQAKQVAEFIKNAPDTCIIHIHCAAGQSRSTGMGIAIAEHFNCDIEHRSGYIVPNKLVYTMVRQALRKFCS